MAKIDASRNYYADLSIPATASDNDIRKSFRKLALEYHPDRHPGQENEWVAKFQQIQAAHEVLSDPQQRAKYDAERRKFRSLNIPPYHTPNTPRSRPPPPPRNTYTSTPTGGQYYRPPPPRPQPPPNPPRPGPQHHNTYTNGAGAERFTSKNFRTPPTAQKTDNTSSDRRNDAGGRANVFTAWQKMKPQARPNATNANPPNNANNPNGTPFGTPLGRSQSTRGPSSGKKGFDPSSTGADEGQARSAYRSNYNRPKASPLDEDMTEDVPFAEANRVRTPYFSTKSGERTSMFGESFSRSASVRNSPTHRPGSSVDPGSYSDSGHRQRASYSGSAQQNPFPQYDSSSEESEEAPVFSKGRKTHNPPPPPPRESPRQKQKSGMGIFDLPHKDTQQTNGTSANAFKSRSEESINMKFSPGAWSGKFEGKPDYFAPQKGNTSRGRTSPSRGRSTQRTGSDKQTFSGPSQPSPGPSPFSQSFTQMPPPPPGPPPLNTQTAVPNRRDSAPHTAKFTPDAWVETFKESSWAYPLPTQSKETSPKRASAASKRSNPARKNSAAPESSVNVDSQSERKPKYQAFAEDVHGGDAMDVDEDSPLMEKTKPAPAFASTASSAKAKTNGTGMVPNGTNTATSSLPSADKRSAPGLNGLAAELGNVAPFLPATNGGLGLDELKDSLPFQSGASQNHPTKSNTAQKLKNPEVPLAPTVPAKLDLASTTDYLSRMESYVRQYRKWNQSMLSHFVAREAELNDLEDRFVHQRGETTNKIGFPGYLVRMKADEEVMETWKVGQEMHMTAMMACQDVRNKTMKQGVREKISVTAEGKPAYNASKQPFGRWCGKGATAFGVDQGTEAGSMRAAQGGAKDGGAVPRPAPLIPRSVKKQKMKG